jgi:mannose-6-phosphate isomerase-like protein (cupin superfamily)
MAEVQVVCHRGDTTLLPAVLESYRLLATMSVFAASAWLAAVFAFQAPAPPAPPAPSSANTPSVFVSSEEIARTLRESIANNVVDQPIKAMDVVAPSGHRASLAVLRRTKAETSALIHDRVTEIYQITEGSGTLVTGGTLDDARATDLTRLNAGPSRTGTHRGGESRHVGPNDVIIVPAGTPHRFSVLDGPSITYMVFRFEPK